MNGLVLLTCSALSACVPTSLNQTAATGSHISITASPGFTNPVFEGNFPDPQIVANGAEGFLAIATNGNGMNVQTLTSGDMVHWKQGIDALPHVASWSSPGKVWAPEIISWSDGTFRMYYVTKAPQDHWQCISTAKSHTLAGPYIDNSSGPLVCETSEGGSIDPSPFVDSSGNAWLYWKNDGNAVGTDSYIKVARLSPDGQSVAGQKVSLFKQSLAWEGRLVEAPSVVEIDGTFHLFYSANDYSSDRYAVGHAVGPTPTGPFRKDREPVLTTNAVAAGPGHDQLIKVGKQWWMVYHAWSPDAIGDESIGRSMWLSQVTFHNDRVDVSQPSSHVSSVPCP